MSNLWKALRDVSRDVDPTVGFEPPAQGSGAGGPTPDGPVTDRADAVTEEPQGRPDAVSAPTPFQQTDLGRRPLPAARPRPIPAPADAPNGRSTPFPSPLPRRPLRATASPNGTDAASAYSEQIARLSQGVNGDEF